MRDADYYDLLGVDQSLLSSTVNKKTLVVMMKHWADRDDPPVYLVGYSKQTEIYMCRIISVFPIKYGPVETIPLDSDFDVHVLNIRNALSKLH